jgi:hypothetical protein
MSKDMLGIKATALGLAALVSVLPLDAPRADTSGSAPSLGEPAPTPDWAESGPSLTGGVATTAVRHRPVAHARHHVWRNGRHYYAYRTDNTLGDLATGVGMGVADLGSVATYPLYCFPDYGSCPVRVPYR